MQFIFISNRFCIVTCIVQVFDELTMSCLTRQCHAIFWQFFFMNRTLWAPDKQAKIVLLNDSFSQRYSNFKYKKFDSTKC